MESIAPQPASVPDAALLAAAQRGDRDAFGALVERHQGKVCAVAYATVGQRALGEELAQEALVVAWRKLGEVASADKLPAWLCGIARNLARNARRREARRQQWPAPGAPVPPAPTPLEQAIERETEAAVDARISALPASLREPLVLCYRDGATAREVAAALGITEDNARKRLSRARARLRDDLRAAEETLPRTGPGRAFTLGVLAAIASVPAPARAAPAGAARGSMLAVAALAGIAATVLVGATALSLADGAGTGGSTDAAPDARPEPLEAAARYRSAPETPTLAEEIPTTRVLRAADDHDDERATDEAVAMAPADAEENPIDPHWLAAQPLVSGSILLNHRDADRDGDGRLSGAEILAFKKRMDDELMDAIAEADAAAEPQEVNCRAVTWGQAGVGERWSAFQLGERPLERVQAMASMLSRTGQACFEITVGPIGAPKILDYTRVVAPARASPDFHVLGQDGGLRVDALQRPSLAHRGGLRVGDVIVGPARMLEADGWALAGAYFALAGGRLDALRLDVLREGVPVQLQLTR